MELLASSNRGGPLTCLKANANVARLWGPRVVIVAASITALSATGCASFDAPQSAISLADLERPVVGVADGGLGVAGNVLPAWWFAQVDPLDSPNVGDLFSVLNSAANVRRSDAGDAPFQPTWPVYMDDDVSVADTGAGFGAPRDEDLPTSPSTSVDAEPAGPDRPLSAPSTDLLSDIGSGLGSANLPVVRFGGPPSPTPLTGALVLPVITSTTMTFPGEVWQGVMTATAVGFLAAILLVPLGCSFVAGAVRAQPRDQPRRKRAPSRLLAELSRAIANVPAH